MFQIFEDYYHFEHKGVRKRSLEPEMEHHSNLIEEAQVISMILHAGKFSEFYFEKFPATFFLFENFEKMVSIDSFD